MYIYVDNLLQVSSYADSSFIYAYLNDWHGTYLIGPLSFQQNVQPLSVSVVVVGAMELFHDRNEIRGHPFQVAQVPILHGLGIVWYHVLAVLIDVQSLGVVVDDGDHDGLTVICVEQV